MKRLLIICLAVIAAAGCIIAFVVAAKEARNIPALFAQSEKIDQKILEESSRKGDKYLVMITANTEPADPESFIAENGVDRADLVSSDESTGTIIVYATPELIVELAGSNYVERILPFFDGKDKPGD